MDFPEYRDLIEIENNLSLRYSLSDCMALVPRESYVFVNNDNTRNNMSEICSMIDKFGGKWNISLELDGSFVVRYDKSD